MNDEVLISIPKALKTRQNAGHFVDYLYTKKNNSFKMGGKFSTLPEYEELLSSLVTESARDLNLLVTQVISFLENVEDIHVKVAIQLTEQFISEIYSFFLDVTNNPFLLDINIAPEIIGGLEIVLSGNFFDLSLKTKVDNYFQNNRDGINEILQK